MLLDCCRLGPGRPSVWERRRWQDQDGSGCTGGSASNPPPSGTFFSLCQQRRRKLAKKTTDDTKEKLVRQHLGLFPRLHGAFVVKYMSGQHSDRGGDELQFPLAASTGREESPALFKQAGETSVSLSKPQIFTATGRRAAKKREERNEALVGSRPLCGLAGAARPGQLLTKLTQVFQNSDKAQLRFSESTEAGTVVTSSRKSLRRVGVQNLILTHDNTSNQAKAKAKETPPPSPRTPPPPPGCSGAWRSQEPTWKRASGLSGVGGGARRTWFYVETYLTH